MKIRSASKFLPERNNHWFNANLNSIVVSAQRIGSRNVSLLNRSRRLHSRDSSVRQSDPTWSRIVFPSRDEKVGELLSKSSADYEENTQRIDKIERCWPRWRRSLLKVLLTTIFGDSHCREILAVHRNIWCIVRILVAGIFERIYRYSSPTVRSLWKIILTGFFFDVLFLSLLRRALRIYKFAFVYVDGVGKLLYLKLWSSLLSFCSRFER